VVVFALRDTGSDARPVIDQPLVLQCGERLPNGVAGDEELSCQLLLGGQPVVVEAAVDLVAQHVGNLTRAVGAGPADRQRYGKGHWSSRYRRPGVCPDRSNSGNEAAQRIAPLVGPGPAPQTRVRFSIAPPATVPIRLSETLAPGGC
jgi:hypothetical protein